MKRAAAVLVSFLWLVVPSAAQVKPNIVMIVLDDGDAESMNLGLTRTKRLIANNNGVIIPNFVTPPECGPARATHLRGQYAQNHRVFVNADSADFFFSDREKATVATRLKPLNYYTGHFGKYLNAWGSCNITGCTPPNPPGWDVFMGTVVHGDGPTAWTQFRYIKNGVLTVFGPDNPSYEPDEVTKHAVHFIRTAPAGHPLLAMVQMRPPHLPATPHPKYVNAPLPGDPDPWPLPPNYGWQPEPTVEEVLRKIRHYPWAANTEAEIAERRATRYRSMLYVDDMIVKIVNTLKATGRWTNTYFIVVSDNGWHQGGHSIPRDKGTAYQETLSPPLWIRGPGIASRRTDLRLAGAHDLAPTILDLAGQGIPRWMDGRSLAPLLFNQQNVAWRTAILGRSWSRYKWDSVLAEDPVDKTLWKLVEWRETGDLELYNLTADKYEQTNLADIEHARVAELKSRLADLVACAGGAQCRAAEGP